MSRIKLEDTMMDILSKMSGGNPGALTVMMSLVDCNAQVDPDSAFGPYSTILDLDSSEIYGSDIWIVFKDICGQDIKMMIALMRARQLGFVTIEDIRQAIRDSYGHKLNLPHILQQVQTRLPKFGH